MEYSCVQLTDLPDEILMIIFKKLRNVEALYSLTDVNTRLNKILHDPVFTSVLTLMDRSVNNRICSLSYPILHRFYLQILPQIHHKIQWLSLEISTMYIIPSKNDPNLYGLGFYGIRIQEVRCLFTNEYFLYRFKDQISSLIVDITESNEKNSTEIIRFIFTNICIVFTNLRSLKFASSLNQCQELSFRSFDTSLLRVFSSSLSELRKSNNDDENLSCIKYYHHLAKLRLSAAHEDYLEEFLLNTKTYLLNHVYLSADHEQLKRVTDNFTRDTTRINCSKMILTYDIYHTRREYDIS
ncbi:hypothetical protein I4U23_017553 [Adineta vaga]|nr:hypothetical protein I4U23_017553 [Adineta vaga]